MLIRPEQVFDFAAVAELHIRAFENRSDEAVIVALLRQLPQYDPALSLVAEAEGQIIGHALFMPYRIRLLEEDVAAANLAPLAVLPAHQGKGIGAALMAEGHSILKAKGIALCFLLGHVSYYPRFGYQTGAFGRSSLRIQKSELLLARKLDVRSPLPTDVHSLAVLWWQQESAVDFAIRPDETLLDWLSPAQGLQARVFVDAGEIVGYARGAAQQPKLFLAKANQYAQAMVAALAEEANSATITLPLHPYSAGLTGTFRSQPVLEAWEAGMALSLMDNPFEAYRARVQAGERLVGRPIFPPAFDLA